MSGVYRGIIPMIVEHFTGEKIDGEKGLKEWVRNLKGDHHQKIGKVAVVSDAKVLSILPAVASHFVAAEVRHFSFAEKLEALKWLHDKQPE